MQKSAELDLGKLLNIANTMNIRILILPEYCKINEFLPEETKKELYWCSLYGRDFSWTISLNPQDNSLRGVKMISAG